jgi:hypothetical protein
MNAPSTAREIERRCCLARERGRLVHKLIDVWWIVSESNRKVRRRLMQLQRYGLPPEAANECMHLVNLNHEDFHAWLQQWISSTRVGGGRE